MTGTGANTLHPENELELGVLIADAADKRVSLEIFGSASKHRLGRPMEDHTPVSTDHLQGVMLYEPNELVVSALAGTSLEQLEHRLAGENQELAFEPVDYGPMLGQPEGKGTVGGMIAANLSGSRRIRAGAARDHVLGIRAVNGRGEAIKSGGRVLKNVTGYDLCKGLTGSWGTLAVFSQITLKVMPRAEECRTLFLVGLGDELAVSAMCAAMGSPFEVSGTVHIQAELTDRLRDAELNRAGHNITAIRLENQSTAVAQRAEKLAVELGAYGDLFQMGDERSRAFWDDMRKLRFLQNSKDPVWRISVAPKDGPAVVKAIGRNNDCKAAYDWSGGLVWLELPASDDASSADIRRAVAQHGGHATLIRADAETRHAVGVFQPLPASVAKLTQGIKHAFDPQGILNPGRMYAGI